MVPTLVHTGKPGSIEKAIENGSVFSNESEYCVDAEQDYQQMIISEAQRRKILAKYGLGPDGCPEVPPNSFEDFESAADLQYMLEPKRLSWWDWFKGKEKYKTEVPHLVLFDYFPRYTALDMNLIAGDEVNVIAEEYQ